MSLSNPFDMITDVNDSKHFWKIAVRITKLWFVQKPPNSGHLEMVLMDSKGHKIQVSVVKEEFNRWLITSAKRMWGELDLDLAQSPLQSSSEISSSNVAKHMKTK
ncbi:hypothetical protein Lal_00022627 [Lupinus albus]|nr:hypothetical protein Lal_00022627 [Lupinus albus]